MRKTVLTAISTLSLMSAGSALANGDMTITENGQALWSGVHKLALPKGESIVQVPVPETLRDGSAQLTGKDLDIREQWVQRLGGQLSSHYEGQNVGVVWDAGGPETKAKLLKAGDNPVFQVGSKIIQGQPHRMIFESIPAGFGGGQLVARVNTQASGNQDVTVRGLVDGFQWSAQYSATLQGDQLSLTPWAALSNQSGMDYSKIRLKIMAGEINRTHESQPMMLKSARADAMPVAMAAAPVMPEREALGGYHLYSLPGVWDLPHGTTKQIPLMNALTLQAQKQLIVRPRGAYTWRSQQSGLDKSNPEIRLVFTNSADQPLPAGVLRLYGTASDGTTQFLGEDNLAPTAAGAEASLTMGRAFDVSVSRKQIDFSKLANDVTEAGYEVTLKNADDKPARVEVQESFAGEWLVLEESQKHQKRDAQTAIWMVDVPAKGEVVLKLRVRVKG